MVIDKNYFLNRLANGEDINTIGNDIADMMNAAMAEHSAAQEAARKAEAERTAKIEVAAKKKALGAKMIDLFREYSDLTVPGAMDGLEITEEDLDTLVEALDQTFQLMGAVKDLKAAIDAIPDEKVPTVHAKLNKAKTKSDDEILADFIASLSR